MSVKKPAMIIGTQNKKLGAAENHRISNFNAETYYFVIFNPGFHRLIRKDGLQYVFVSVDMFLCMYDENLFCGGCQERADQWLESVAMRECIWRSLSLALDT